jgi:glycosyltransferase involved in cell wall biosynthesis
MGEPRLLLVNYEYPPLGGGAGTATAGMAHALTELGCQVMVLTSRFRGQPALERVGGFTIRRVAVLRRRLDRCTPPEMLTFLASAALAAHHIARDWRPDLTIAFFGIPSGPVAWLLRVRHGVPYIVSLRGGDVPGFNWAPGTALYHRLTAPFIRFLWRRAEAVVANGSGLRQLAEAALPGLRVPVIPNGVAAEHITPRAWSAGSAEIPVRLLLVGRLVHQKGADLLLRALGAVQPAQFRLDIVGDGPDRGLLRDLAARENIADRVQFTGWIERDRLAEYYRAADVFVFPSRIEGMPNVVLEAMAYGLPIIASDVPGNRELILHEDTGLLVPPEDPPALAAAIERLIGEAALRQQLGGRARAHVLEHHTWKASAAAYLRLAGIKLPVTRAAVNEPAPVVH